MNKPMLMNAWYAAIWSDDLDQQMEARDIIGESILLYRDGGSVHAMSNHCPHRFAPLHLGKLVNGNVQCPYHALEYNCEGKCVNNPNGTKKIPSKSDLRVYPVVEKHELLWVWMGDPDQKNESMIPDFSVHSNPDMVTVKGTIEMDAYYELITDNLMDLTHAVTVHHDCLGSEAIARGVNKVSTAGTTVWSNSWCADGIAPPAWDAALGNYGKPVDHWLYMRWDSPANMLLDVGVTPVGKSRNEGVWIYGTDILTPIGEDKTRYFWAITALTDDPVAFRENWIAAIKHAFEGQDKPMIEAQQKMLKTLGVIDVDDLKHAAISTDAGPARARYVLNKLRNADGERCEGSIADPQNPDLDVLLRKSLNETDTVEPVV